MTFSTAFQADAFQNDAFQIESTPVTQRFTGAGSWNKNWAKDYGPEKQWIVRRKNGRRKKFDTAEDAAIAAAQTPGVIGVTYGGVDFLAEFRKIVSGHRAALAADNVPASVSALLERLEAEARYRAAEMDDEEAILLLLN